MNVPNEQLNKVTKGSKTAGIIVSIIMVILGILILSFRLAAAVSLAWVGAIAFLGYGVFDIYRYIKTPKDTRNGWRLASGIIAAVIAVLIMLEGTLSIILTTSYAIAFFAMFSGISSLCSIGLIKKAGGSSGWAIFSGIVNVILSFIILGSPIIGLFALEWVLAIYLIVFGIAVFAESCSGGGSDNNTPAAA